MSETSATPSTPAATSAPTPAPAAPESTPSPIPAEGTPPAPSGDAPATDAPPAAAKTDEKAETSPRVAKALAQFAKREAKIVQREQEFKAAQDAFSAKVAEFEARLQRAMTNPDALYEGTPWNFDKHVDYRLNDGKPTPAMKEEAVTAKMAELERKQQEFELAQLKAAQDYQLAQYKGVVSAHVDANADKFPTLRALADLHKFSPADVIYETVQGHYNETKRVLTYEEAADHVERTLREQEEARLQRLLEVEPFKKYRAPSSAAPTPGANESLPPGSQVNPGPATLTNNLAAQQPPKEKRKGVIPRDESIRRLAAQLMTSD